MADQVVIEYVGKVDKLQSNLRDLEKAQLSVSEGAKKSGETITKESERASKGVEKVEKNVNGLDASFKKVAGAIAGVFAVSSILSFGKEVINITAKFQKFEAVLTNTLGSKSAAQKALSMIKDFAASTPFAVDELTESYVKLVNQGFKPTQEEMRKMGDLAASQGKSFNQLTEAIIDAQTGEFERLKEFGIRASKEGDKVKFTFKGVETQTKFTNNSIRDYILSLGDLQGVSGGMAAISKTLGGQISNLGDSFDALQVALGDRFEGAASDSIRVLGELTAGLTDFVSVPVSKKLQEEQFELNALVSALMNTNNNQEVRNQLIGEIQTKYPDFLKNIDIETASNEVLRGKLEEVNRQYINKIILQKQQEKFETQAGKQADALFDVVDAEKDLASAILQVNEKLKSQQKAGENNIQFAKRLIKELIDSEIAGEKIYRNTLALAISDLEKAQKDLGNQNKKSNDILKEKLDLEKRLGVSSDETTEKTKEKTEVEINSIESLREKIKQLTEQRDKQTDVSDVKKIHSLTKEIETIDELIKRLLGQDEATKKAKKERDEYNELIKRSIAIQKELSDFTELQAKTEIGSTKITKEEADKRHKARVSEMKKFKTEVTDVLIKYSEEAEEAHTKKLLEGIAKRRAAIKEGVSQSIDIFSQLLTGLNELQLSKATAAIEEERSLNAKREEEQLASLENRSKLGLISERQLALQKEKIRKDSAKKESELKRRQYEADQKAALARVNISTAEAIVKTFATYGFTPVAFIAAAGAAAKGEIEKAFIRAQPVPKFKEGVIDFKGKGTQTSDSNTVQISNRESVIKAKQSIKYKSALTAINDDYFDKYADINFVQPALKKERERLRIKEDRERVAHDYMSTINKNGSSFDTSHLEHLTKRNKSVKLENDKDIISGIGQEFERVMKNKNRGL